MNTMTQKQKMELGITQAPSSVLVFKSKTKKLCAFERKGKENIKKKDEKESLKWRINDCVLLILVPLQKLQTKIWKVCCSWWSYKWYWDLFV